MYEHTMKQRATYLLSIGLTTGATVNHIVRDYGILHSEAKVVVDKAKQAIVRHAIGVLSYANTMEYRQ